MADLGLNGWSADQEEPLADFGLLPKGWYEGYIEASEWKESKNKPGNKYLNITVVLTDESAKGRKFWPIFCLKYQEQKTVSGARRSFASLCKATGRISPNDSDELHNIPIGIQLGHEKDQYGEMRNKVTNYCSQAELSKKKQNQPAKPVGNALGNASWNAAPQTPPPAPPIPPPFPTAPPQTETIDDIPY